MVHVLVLQTVQQRGAAVIKARKLSSAMSAAKAICDHMRDIWSGTPEVNGIFICAVVMMLGCLSVATFCQGTMGMHGFINLTKRVYMHTVFLCLCSHKSFSHEYTQTFRSLLLTSEIVNISDRLLMAL